MTAFVGAASATLFTSEPEDPVVTEINDTAGTQFERQLMDIIEEHHFSRESLSTFFVETELEDSPMSTWETAEPMGVPVNSYERPTAAILLTPRNNSQAPAAINRPIPAYPTNPQLTTSISKTNNPLIMGINKHTEFQTIFIQTG